MKAIVQDRYGSADVLELRDIDDPVIGENDVLVRVHAAAAGPDVWHIMTGKPYMARPVLGFRRPKVPVRGWDVAGTVEAVGANITRFVPGDEVMGGAAGSFAGYANAPGLHGRFATLGRDPRHGGPSPVAAAPARPDPEGDPRGRRRGRRRPVDRRFLPRDPPRAAGVAVRRPEAWRVELEDDLGGPPARGG